MPLGRKFWEGVGARRSASQENCLFDNHRFTHERWGGDFGKHATSLHFPASAEFSIMTLSVSTGRVFYFSKKKTRENPKAFLKTCVKEEVCFELICKYAG